MLVDLFGDKAQVSPGLQKASFSDREVEGLFDEFVLSGLLLEDAGDALMRLKNATRGDVISATRKEAWKELLWIYGLDEPSPVSFDVACALCDVDSERVRNLISQGFGDELRLMYFTLSCAVPQKKEVMGQRLGRYIFLH